EDAGGGRTGGGAHPGELIAGNAGGWRGRSSVGMRAAAKDHCRAIALVNVAIDHHGTLDQLVTLKGTDGDSDVVNHAKTFAMVREGMMKASAEIDTHTALK